MVSMLSLGRSECGVLDDQGEAPFREAYSLPNFRIDEIPQLVFVTRSVVFVVTVQPVAICYREEPWIAIPKCTHDDQIFEAWWRGGLYRDVSVRSLFPNTYTSSVRSWKYWFHGPCRSWYRVLL